jgi:hypothetical protein
MGRRIILPALLALALASSATPAVGQSGDVAATQTYLNANYALLRAAKSARASSKAALQGILHGVRRECLMAAAESPQDPNSEALTFELVGAMIVLGTRPDQQAISRFAGTVASLRFSSRKLTSTVRSYAQQLGSLSRLAAPGLCADVRAWAASGFRTLPATTTAFNQRYKAINVPIGNLPGGLARFERPAQRGLLARTRELELEVADFEAEAVETWEQIMGALALNP